MTSTYNNSSYMTQTGMVIEPSHAYFNIFGVDKVFNTIKAKSYHPLQEALVQGVVTTQTKLMVFEVGEQTVSIPLRDIAFHHVAEGERNGIAWTAVFCGACNMGIVLNPVLDGQTYHFSATGIYHGMAIIRDSETGSFWEHATGECIQGELQGSQLETIPAQRMLVKQVLETSSSALIVTAKQSWLTRLLDFLLLRPMLTTKGHMPAIFRLSMGKRDMRLPEMQLGLGIWINGQARFYAVESLKTQNNAIIDTLNQENLIVFIDPVAKVPIAHRCQASAYTWEDNTLVLDTGERIRNGFMETKTSVKKRIDAPEQQFVRWYAFSYKFPNCEIFAAQA